jgi:hypothetical protein
MEGASRYDSPLLLFVPANPMAPRVLRGDYSRLQVESLSERMSRSPLKLAWSTTNRMLVRGVFLGGLFGLIWGPASILGLFQIALVGRVLGVVADRDLGSPSILPLLLIVAALLGSASGTLVGLATGIIVGPLLAILLRAAGSNFIQKRSLRLLANAAGDSIGGLMALWVTTGFDVAAMMRPDAAFIGWLLWVVIPTTASLVLSWRSVDDVILPVLNLHSSQQV